MPRTTPTSSPLWRTAECHGRLSHPEFMRRADAALARPSAIAARTRRVLCQRGRGRRRRQGTRRGARGEPDATHDDGGEDLMPVYMRTTKLMPAWLDGGKAPNRKKKGNRKRRKETSALASILPLIPLDTFRSFRFSKPAHTAEMEGQVTHPVIAAAAVSLVLGDDDLLREIILRLAFPTDLVRAAVVSRRWLRVASGQAFLRRYRALHPPRVLGLFAKDAGSSRFLPLPQPPELAAAAHRAASGAMVGSLDDDEPLPVFDCRNGRILMDLSDPFDRSDGTFAVVSPLLHAARSLAVLPPVPLAARPPTISAMGDDDTLLGQATDVCILLPEDGGDGQSYTVVTLVRSKRMDWGVWWEFSAKVSVLRAGAWDDDVRATVPVELPARCRGETSWNRSLLVHGKLYVLGMQSHAILVLDLASMAASFINLPEGVRHEQDGDLDLFRSNDYGVNLIHVKGFQARVWRRRRVQGNNDDGLTGNWVLVDDICVRQAFDHLAKLDRELDNGGSVRVVKVGDDCEFVFLCVDGEVFYIDVRRKMVEKVFEVAPKKGGVLPVIHPLMMAWPPIFPVLE